MSRFSYNQWILAAITIFVGLNLRPIMASISPIVPVLTDSIKINNQTAGLLTTFPVAMMGCFALLGPRIQSRVSEYVYRYISWIVGDSTFLWLPIFC